MPTRIAPMLAVADADAAIAFYRQAFGAAVRWRLGDDHVVAGLEIDGAEFFLAAESPANGTRGPSSAGSTTVRIERFVDDAVSVQRRAVAAGAIEKDPVREHEHEIVGTHPIRRMRQGAVIDPAGHMWLIGTILA